MNWTGWIPIGISPKEWEGKGVLWRTAASVVTLQTIPKGFSRLSRHCRDIEVCDVAGSNPVSEIPDLIEELLADREELLDRLAAVGGNLEGFDG